MKNTIKAILLGGAGAAALTAALSGAGSANASCASLNGHNIGQGCKSTPGSVAVGIGRDAQATSLGTRNVAIAVGKPGDNPFYGRPGPTLAYADGTGNTSVALGNGSNAGTLGTRNTALAVGNGSNAFSYGGVAHVPITQVSDYKPSSHNTSVTVGNGSEAGAVGDHDKVSSAFGNNRQRQNNGLGG